MIKRSKTRVYLAWLLVGVISAGCRVADGKWVAYNECLPGPNTHANTTRWSPYGTTSGPLKDVQTGTNIYVSLTLTDSGTNPGSKSGTPAAGTPAFVLFNGYVDWTNSPNKTNSIQVVFDNSLRYTFGGLSPSKKYTFRGTVVRGNATYTNRWTLLEIIGAKSFGARHTANVLTAVQLPGQLKANEAAMNTGDNTSGDMVIWQNIVPSSNGTFSVASCQFTGTIPGKSTAGPNGYALEMIRLEESDPPLLVSVSPLDGTLVSNLTQIVVTFNKSVTNVSAGALLINGVAATGVSGSSNVYTFTFPQPSASHVSVTWSANHGITDLSADPELFDAANSSWQYSAPDVYPPSVVSVFPPAGVKVRCLSRIAVTFTEPVSNVTSSALLVGGQAAQWVTGAGAGPYTFLFMQPATGAVQVSWAPGQGIKDTASPPNAFAGGGAWTNVVELDLQFDMTVPYVIHISVDGLGAAYLRDYLSNAPAMFPNFKRLADQGASTLEARCDYFNSVTMPNHTSILTGRPVYQPTGWSNTTYHGIDFDVDPGGTVHAPPYSGNSNVSYIASTLDVAHDCGLSTAFYASKSKFDFFVRSYNAVNGEPDLVGADNGRNKIDKSLVTDAGTNWYCASDIIVSSLVNDLTNAPLNYTFLHFAEPDYAGHNSRWGGTVYSNAVRHVDCELGRIFAAIDGTPALWNRVAIVLTADHGGINYGHGNPVLYVEYSLPFFIWGPAVSSPVDTYRIFSNRGDPSTNRPDYNAAPQPLHNGDSGNTALALLGLPPIWQSSLVCPDPIPSVTLEMVKPTDAVTLFWPSGAEGFQLQWVSNLIALPGGWASVSGGITTNGALKSYEVPIPPADPARFYRVGKP